jgi:hypothetical protein
MAVGRFDVAVFIGTACVLLRNCSNSSKPHTVR